MATALQNTGPAGLVDPTTGFPTPPRLLRVVDGHRLVSFTGQYAASNGSYAAGMGLFAAPEGSYHSHVVWALILRPTGEWIVEGGTYCQNFAHALESYVRRGGVTT